MLARLQISALIRAKQKVYQTDIDGLVIYRVQLMHVGVFMNMNLLTSYLCTCVSGDNEIIIHDVI